MRVAVVVPFYNEPSAQLEQCFRSVNEQSHPADLIAVGDGVQLAARVQGVKVQRLIELPFAHADFGNCARAIGALDAIGAGYDAVCFLDADNWLHPKHVAELVGVHVRSCAAVVTCAAYVTRVDGTTMFVHGENDGKNHVDTSCYFIARPAFGLLGLWALIPPELGCIGDRVYWGMVRQALLTGDAPLLHAHNQTPTVFYRSRYASHYRAIGEEPPPGCKENADPPPGVHRINVPRISARLELRPRKEWAK